MVCKPGTQMPGYNWSEIVADPYGGFDPTDPGLRHHALRIASAVELCQTAIKPVVEAAGFVTAIETHDMGLLTKKQYHMQLPATKSFVIAANLALEAAGRELRFGVYEGKHFPHTLFMDRLAKDGTVLLSTDPELSEHDMMYHGLGWVALPDSVVMGGFRKRAQEIGLIDNVEIREREQIKYMNRLEGNINVIHIEQMGRRTYIASIIAGLTGLSYHEVQTARQHHLYGTRSINETT